MAQNPLKEKEESRFVITESMAQCVMIAGTSWMQELCVDSLTLHQKVRLITSQ